MMKLNNKYYILRHGEALSNVKDIVSSSPEKFNNHLTKKGRKTIKEVALKLKDKNINLIFTSPLLRTEQTAEIVGKILTIKPKTDKRLEEIDFGIFNFGYSEKMWKFFKDEKERIKKGPPKGESYTEALERIYNFLKDTDKKYKEKNILIISHQGPLFLLEGKVRGLSLLKIIKNDHSNKRIHEGEVRELN